jgi:beta-phosphoglucomutase
MCRKALLVDLDGTLVDTREANYLAYAAALNCVNVKLERRTWQASCDGRNWRQFLPALVGHLPRVKAADVAAKKAAIYPTMLSNTRVNDGLLRRLRAARGQARIALVTTASRTNADAVLRHHGLTDLFDLVVTGCDVEHHKPSPEAFRLAAKHLQAGPDDCLVFEDSAIGRSAAAAFGARCIAISLRARDHSTRDDLAQPPQG